MPRSRHPRPDTGSPPVPVAVILTPTFDSGSRLRRTTPAPPRGGITVESAALLIATYTRDGDLIANPDRDPVVAAAAQHLGRATTTIRPRLAARAAGPATVALAITRLPHPRGRVSRRLELRPLTEWAGGWRRRLTPGGFLIVTIADEALIDGCYVDHATGLITAARAAGLTYHQHLVAVHHTPGRDQDPTARHLIDGRHARVHADLYVFAVGDIDA